MKTVTDFIFLGSKITEEGILTSPCYSLELCIQMGISFLFSFALGNGNPLQYSRLENPMVRGAW